VQETVNVRLGRTYLDRLREAAAKHPLRPTLRAAIERGIELMVAELERKNDDGK